MDKSRVDQALKDFSAKLPDAPEWMIVIRVNGEFISRIGEYSYLPHMTIDDNTASLATFTHGMNLLTTLDHLRFGNLQYSLTIGSKRMFMLVHLNDAFFLGISYIGVQSIDATIEEVLLWSRDILEAVNPTM